MKILGIETSCDETAVAVVRYEGGRFFVDDHVVSSQVKTHQKYGGVIPEVAARMHVPVLPELIARITQWKRGNIDAVAVTAGPGLATSLRVGIETAKALAVSWNVPLVPVDHMEGHVASAMIGRALTDDWLPALALIVSGGHTEWVRIRALGAYTIIGQTRDDAVGEAYDKVAALLGLPYPGGPSVDRSAKLGNAARFDFPRPMISDRSLDVSFSGLKTAVRYLIDATPQAQRDVSFVQDVCAAFVEAVMDVLMTKTQRAIEQEAPRTLLLGGGVAASPVLRARLQTLADENSVALWLPEMAYTTDNAAMIAAAGALRFSEGDATHNPFALDAEPAHVLGELFV